MKKVYEFRGYDGKMWISTTEYDDGFLVGVGFALILLGVCIWGMVIHLIIVFSMLIGLFMGAWMFTGRTTVKPKDK